MRFKKAFMVSILLLAATVAFAEPPEAIQRVPLDERVVVTVPVATNRVTTISFPGPIVKDGAETRFMPPSLKRVPPLVQSIVRSQPLSTT